MDSRLGRRFARLRSRDLFPLRVRPCRRAKRSCRGGRSSTGIPYGLCDRKVPFARQHLRNGSDFQLLQDSSDVPASRLVLGHFGGDRPPRNFHFRGYGADFALRMAHVRLRSRADFFGGKDAVRQGRRQGLGKERGRQTLPEIPPRHDENRGPFVFHQGKREGFHHSPACRPVRHRIHRRAVRRRFHSRHFRGDARPVHRLYIQHHGDSRFAIPLLRLGGNAHEIHKTEIRHHIHSGVCRHENADYGFLQYFDNSEPCRNSRSIIGGNPGKPRKKQRVITSA